MRKILLFAGTSEGRKLSEHISSQGMLCHVCVATEYGELLQPKGDNLVVHAGRMDVVEMEAYIEQHAFDAVIDATHPYAVEVSANIRQACRNREIPYQRFLRTITKLEGNVVRVESAKEAIAYLNKTEGNILLTTGSKELPLYIDGIMDCERLYARVLANPEVLIESEKAGLMLSHLLCMQGPFSKELNKAILQQIKAKWLVTKETGKNGGFTEKLEAAKEAGANVIVIKRPEEEGMKMSELCDWMEINKPKAQITLLGIGMGKVDLRTVEAEEALRNADCLIGAERMLQSLQYHDQPKFNMYKSTEIVSFIKVHTEYENIVVALSGDVGFYSGAKALIEELKEYPVRLVCGISSVVYFASRIQIPWEDIKLCSAHGRMQNIVGMVREHTKVFALVGTAEGIRGICGKLLQFGYGKVKVIVGSNLSYEDETILSGTPATFLEFEANGVHVIYIENEDADQTVVTHGVSDDSFFRGKVPMTKEEVRSISLSKLRLTKDSVIYDIGAGTGSIAIECALQARDGMVYAVERKSEAIELIQANKERHGACNLEVIQAYAPDGLQGLPAPTHTFIGGSAGNLRAIIQEVLRKNETARIVINVIALETLTETINLIKELDVEDLDIVQVSISKSKTLAGYHMMMGQNPVWILSFTGKKGN